MKKRKFWSGSIAHIYQRATDKGVIFYDEIDRLIFYMYISVYSKKYNISVLGASIMYTHFHLSLRADRMTTISKCLQDSISAFARAYNVHYRRQGNFFKKNFGCSCKRSSKEIRNNLAYVFNNHVEKSICKTAIDHRWSLLAYALSGNPFSEPLNKTKASASLLKSLKIVSKNAKRQKIIRYDHLEKMLSSLYHTEREQLIDHIVREYSLIDFKSSASFFGGIDYMLDALNNMTGNEYHIHEDYSNHPDSGYTYAIGYLNENGIQTRMVYNMSEKKKRWLAELLILNVDISESQIRKLLHF